MAKGLKLDQFKEPAFSSDILKIKSKKVYVNCVHNLDVVGEKLNLELDKNEFKFLVPEHNRIKKDDIIAYRLVDNLQYSSVNIYAYDDCVVRESKYLMTEVKTPLLFMVLDVVDGLNQGQQNCDDVDEFKLSDIPVSDKNNLSIDDLIELAHKASIIDETDGVYLFEKFQEMKANLKDNKHHKIYIDALDDQPYTSSKESLLMHYHNEINFATNVIKNVFALDDLDIMFYDVEDYNREKKIQKKNFDTRVISLKVNYPARYFISKKHSYMGSIGVQAVLHFSRVLLNSDYKQTTTFVTVAGDSVCLPQNIEVAIGTSVDEVMGHFEFGKEVKRIIFGQVMTGHSISCAELPISATTRSLLFFSDYKVSKQLECIGCSRCNYVCPQNLLPCYRYKFKETNNESYQNFSSDEDCLRCYCCSFICPSHIKLV